MDQESERFDLLNDLNGRLLTMRDQLSEGKVGVFLDSLVLGFFDLKHLLNDLGVVGFDEICEDLQQILGQVSAGKRSFDNVSQECVVLAIGLMYRRAVNNEPCQQEVEDLTLLVQGVKFGDSMGFEVTDHKVPLDVEEQVVLFENGEGEENTGASTVDVVPDSGALAVEPEGSRAPLNMLIVDDELQNRTLLRHIVSSFGTCDFAVDGVEAVQAFQMAYEDGTPYDVVFLDIMMPEMDGHQALQKMRTFEQASDLFQGREATVFMVTCLDAPKDVCQAFFKGRCTDYITKPIIKDRIIEKMREYDLLPG